MSRDTHIASNRTAEEGRRDDKQVVKGIIDNFENQFYEDLHASRGRSEQLIEKEKEQDIKLLRQAWIKEKMVPDILPYEEGLIERIIERIRNQLAFIEMNSVELQTQEKDIKLMLVIVESELERVQFLIRSYVRLRLQKIDQYALHIQENEHQRKKLNSDEITYMEGHLAMLYELFEDQFLRKTRIRESNIGEDESMVDEPDLDRHVFLQCTEPARATIDAEELLLSPGEVYVMRYRNVAKLLSQGHAVVI